MANHTNFLSPTDTTELTAREIIEGVYSEFPQFVDMLLQHVPEPLIVAIHEAMTGCNDETRYDVYAWATEHYISRRLIAGFLQRTTTIHGFSSGRPEYTIHNLHTMLYQDYLQTAHWRRVRRAAIERAGRRCQLCNADGPLEVHHRTYERRGAELPEDVIALCQTCHGRFHGDTAAD